MPGLRIATEKQTHTREYGVATFELRPMSKTERADLLKKHTQTKKGVEDTDWVGLLVDKIDRQVVGWSGIDGDPECNRENKKSLAILKENEHICSFLVKELDKIGSELEEEKKEELGN